MAFPSPRELHDISIGLGSCIQVFFSFGSDTSIKYIISTFQLLTQMKYQIKSIIKNQTVCCFPRYWGLSVSSFTIYFLETLEISQKTLL